MANEMAPISGKFSLPPRVQALGMRMADEPHGQTLRATTAQIEAAQTWLPGLRTETRPATAEERISILFAMADVVGKPDVMRNGSQAAQTQFWVIYHELLGHLPVAVLKRITMAFLKAAPGPGGKWFPDPGTLLAYAKQDEAYRDQMKALHGLERLAKAKPEPSPDEYVDLTEADISRMVRERIKRAAELDAADAADREVENRAARDRLRAPEPPFDNAALLNVYAAKGRPHPEPQEKAA